MQFACCGLIKCVASRVKKRILAKKAKNSLFALNKKV